MMEYDFICECGHRWAEKQAMMACHDTAKCPKCGQLGRRHMGRSATPVIYNGEGFTLNQRDRTPQGGLIERKN